MAIIRRVCVCVTHEDWLSFRKCLHKFTLLKRIIGTIPSGQHITSCHCIHPHCLLSHSSGPRWKDLMATPHVCNQRLYNAFCLGLTIQFDSFLTAIFALVPLAELARAFWSDGGNVAETASIQQPSTWSYLPDCPCRSWKACMSSCWCSGEAACTEVASPGRTAAAHTALCTGCWNWFGKSEAAPQTTVTCLRVGRNINIILPLHTLLSLYYAQWIGIFLHYPACFGNKW